MIYTSIAIAILIINVAPLLLKSKRAATDSWQWWHIPWLAFLYVVAAYAVFHLTNVHGWPWLSSLYDDGAVEACYVLLCAVVWLPVRWFLRKPSVHKSLIALFRKITVGTSLSDDIDSKPELPFPYFIDHQNVVRSKVGKMFYRRLLAAVIAIVAIVHALLFIFMEFAATSFPIISAFALFALIPTADYYWYLRAEVPEERGERREGSGETSAPSDLEELWQQYISTFTNYSVAWKRKNHKEEDAVKDNLAQIADLMTHFTGGQSTQQRCDCGFLENSDLTQAFAAMEPLFDWERQNGRLVIVAFDIPNHFTKTTRLSYLQEIANELKTVLQKGADSIEVCDEYTPEEVLNSSIVIASVAVLSRRSQTQGAEITEEWMKRIGLVVVVNLPDKSVANLFECRKFSYLLRSVNQQHQILFITPHFRDVEPSLKNTWLTGSVTVERRLKQPPQGHNQFFIAYNFEDYLERYKSIMTSLPNEPLSAISEMAPIALSTAAPQSSKGGASVTPVHFFDLAYTNIIEGNEELGKFYQSSIYPVKSDDINKHIHCHLLPIGTTNMKQIFSVIPDQDNNAPAAYLKWIHRGSEENLSVVISKPYLFRDYFNANHHYFTSVPFIALQPQLSKSRVTLAVILLGMLQKAGIDENQLRGLLLGFYEEDEIQSLPTIVNQLLTTYFSNDLAGKLRTSHTVTFDGCKYHHQTTYEINYTDRISLSYLDHISIKDESDNVLFVIIQDLMYQNFEKGQIHSFLGKPYEILAFEKENMTLRVKAANTQAINVVFHKPVLQLEMDDRRRNIEVAKRKDSWIHRVTGQELGLDFDAFETNVAIQANRWYEFHRYNINSCTYQDAKQPHKRIYENGRVLKVSMRYLRKIEYVNRIDDIRKSLQILIYEAMQSVFPHHAQYLVVSTIGDGDPELPWIFNKFICNEKDEEGKLSFYFTEDAHIDLGLIGALANKDIFGANYLFRYIYDYLLWLTEGNTVPSGDYDEYLCDTNLDKHAFLKYGREKLPTYFDIDLLINFIRDFFCEEQNNVLQGVTERTKHQDVSGACDFCGKEMQNSDMQCLSDGRMRCPDCTNDAIDTDKQFREQCEKVRKAFLTHLNIDFNTIPHNARLVSAVELHKLGGYKFTITNGYDVRKATGIAFDSQTDTFYVESGYKSDKTFGIIAHEMTHIWQYSNEDFQKVKTAVGAPLAGDLVEGLAVWTDLFLSEKNGSTNIDALRQSWLARNDEYGRGLKFIMAHCPEDPYKYIRDEARKTQK